MNHSRKKIFLLIGDVLMLYASLYLALLVRYLAVPAADIWRIHFWPFTIIFAAWIVIFYINDLYNLHLAVNNNVFLGLAVRSVIIAGMLSALFFYINPDINIAPKTNLLIFIIIFTLLFLVWRRFYNWSLSSYLPKEQVLVVGYDEGVKELVDALENNPHLGYRVASVIAENVRVAGNIPVISDVSKIKEIVAQQKISLIVLATDPRQLPELRTALFSCLPLKISIMNLPAFYEAITGRIPIYAIGEMWFLENLAQGQRSTFDVFKRLYDFILALILLVATFPFWLVIMAIIKLESAGPAFFKSRRLGKNKSAFDLLKFRTMREEGNDRSLTRKDDPRVTKFGSLLRKTRIDELPQVLNILRGEMSFVGPRPERPELITELEKAIPFYQERMLVKPGLTGSDQISGEYHSPTRADTLKKLQYDLFYIKNRSIYLDLSIILKTVATVFKRGGV